MKVTQLINWIYRLCTSGTGKRHCCNRNRYSLWFHGRNLVSTIMEQQKTDDVCVVEEIVTKFMLSTCRMRPQLRKNDMNAAALRARLANTHSLQDEEFGLIPLTTGSVAEFYIEPMLPDIGDVDVMFYCNGHLAIPRGHPPPTHLPAEFHHYIKVFEMFDTVDYIADIHFPAYVYLLSRYLLTESVDDSKYYALEYDSWERTILSNRQPNNDMGITHGPAFRVHEDFLLPSERVWCIRCLVWPPQAADWPTRHRNYGWPDSAEVDRIISNGCDVVGVSHRQCRQHEEMSEYQWRLSFSRAEIVLINSWMPVQQIVYHMLRVFVKTERFTDSADNSEAGTLSNYHIKTLMLWACELKPRSWWSDDRIMKICAQLLHTMGVWLTNAQCKHYFIKNCNLIDKSFDTTNTGSRLKSTVTASLSKWFVDNYIRKCAQLCPGHVSELFDDVGTYMKLRNAVSSVVSWRIDITKSDLWDVFNLTEYGIAVSIYENPLTARSCSCLMTDVAKMDSRLSVYLREVAFLHVAHKSSRHGFNDELVDVLATLFGQFVSGRHYSRNNASLSLSKAEELMKVVANNSLNSVSLIKIELSKAFLYRALRCTDSESDSIYCLANVYLAVLCYCARHYQTAIDHCTLVMRSQDHSQCSSHVVQGELLPSIDDNIDNMLGLAVFYQYVQAAALNYQCPAQHVSVFTTNLLAHYVYIKCLPLIVCRQYMETSSTDELQLYQISVSNTERLFISDVLLLVLLSRLSFNTTEGNASDLVELLQTSAVEHLTAYRQIEARDFGSEVTIVASDFEALYAYKHGDYQRCLELCTQNVCTLLSVVEHARLPTFPEFSQFMDDDIVSLSALTWFLNTECKYIAGYICITQLTLSLYLMTQCQLKLRHSVMSLVQTLHNVGEARKIYGVDKTLDRLVLKMIAHKAVTYINNKEQNMNI